MKKKIPFKKDIIFGTRVAEITSISLDHNLKIENNNLVGNFIVSGDYKITEASVQVSPFSYEIPFKIAFDEKYDLESAVLDIDDFYYEIIDNSVLNINIEVGVDNIEEKEERCIEEEEKEEPEEQVEINSLFDSITDEDTYKTYKVYIIREQDTIEKVIETYNSSKEVLEQYNDLSNIKLGDKIIIPVQDEGD